MELLFSALAYQEMTEATRYIERVRPL